MATEGLQAIHGDLTIDKVEEMTMDLQEQQEIAGMPVFLLLCMCMCLCLCVGVCDECVCVCECVCDRDR